MELNSSTFFLEIINFLVLIWILKRFLYKPVLKVIERRRAGIEKTLMDAQTLKADAEKLQDQYESRLEDWAQEKHHSRESLSREIEAERAHKLAELDKTLEQEREKARVANERLQADTLRKMEETALEQGARFASRLLQQAAGPEVESQLIEIAINEMSSLPEQRIHTLRTGIEKSSSSIIITSAYTLSDKQRESLQQALSKLIGKKVMPQYKENRDLQAGIRIALGSWSLSANLQDELQGFTELSHGD